MKKVIVIAGPTGSGKTALSIALAKTFHAEIINGDSVQVYQGYDIGSSKISDNDMQGIKHHLLSHVSPSDSYDVSRFQKEGREIINHIKMPIVCGGTGLYIKALLYDYEFKPYEKTQDNLSVVEKIAYILEHDKDIQLDVNNTRRVESAYQLIKHGYKKTDIASKDTPLYDVCTIYLDIDRLQLKDILKSRLDTQIQQGFIEEVKRIKQSDRVKPFIGYKEVDAYLEGQLSYEDMKHEIIKKSMLFAKRQKTWFKNQMHTHVFQAQDKDLIRHVSEVISKWR
jgi:tRNA dimethylallyltransferase